MTKQQRTLLLIAVAVLAGMALFVYLSVERAREMEQKLIEAEWAATNPMEIPPPPEPDFSAVLRDSKALLKTIAAATERLEEGHTKRRLFKERGMVFPADLDASFRRLRDDTIKRLQQLEEILAAQMKLTRRQQVAEELLALSKQAAAFRDVVQRTDFGVEPPTK